VGDISNPADMKCQACGAQTVRILCNITQVPVHSVKLVDSRQAAIDIQKGNIRLGFCEACGFIFNVDYDPMLHKYASDRYESTQVYSSTFNEFHLQLAQNLIDKYELKGKTVIEIGCGQGEFLHLLAELGDIQGIGFDPAFLKESLDPRSNGNVRIIKDYYSEKYAQYDSDLICCKMTLEHIHNPLEFVKTIRRSIGPRKDTLVFFQVPDVTRVLREIAFWDIYYEHCSYFSPESLESLFQECGFEIIDLRREYGDQYLMIEARPTHSGGKFRADKQVEIESLVQVVDYFSHNFNKCLREWKLRIRESVDKNQRVVIWGAGSKGVAFLTTLGITAEILYAVDINPRKQGTYMAGSGQEIIAPQFLVEYQPETIFVMNPIYISEIRSQLQEMEVEADLVGVE
jgi:SAM-dependent methyltransferase